VKRLVLLVVLLCGGLAAAAFTVPSDAASIGSQGISKSALDSDLSAIDSSAPYQCYLRASAVLDSQGQASLPGITGVGQSGATGSHGIYDGAFVRFWLSRMVDSEVVSQLASARHLSVSPSQRAAAKVETEQVIDGTFTTLQQDSVQPDCAPVPSGAAVLASLPSSFANWVVTDQATSDLLAASAVGSDLTQSSMDRYYQAHSGDFDTLCVSWVTLSSQAAATQAQASVNSGTPLAAVAPSGSTAQSACITPTDGSYQPVQQAVANVPIGGFSQPLAAGSGSYYLFQLTNRTPSTLAESQPVLRAAIIDAGLSKADSLVAGASKRSGVSVDPRYGDWTETSDAAGLLPPPSPPSTSLLSPSADVPPGGGSS
jgi:hypothetical protein